MTEQEINADMEWWQQGVGNRLIGFSHRQTATISLGGDQVQITRRGREELLKMETNRRIVNLNAEALAEIKASLDGNSTQTVQQIMNGLMAEIVALR